MQIKLPVEAERAPGILRYVKFTIIRSSLGNHLAVLILDKKETFYG